VNVWRLASGRYPPLSGEGARLVGGRCNSPGRPLVYTSESLALCLAECLVHIPGRLPTDYVAFTLSIPDDSVEIAGVGVDPVSPLGITRTFGDAWLAEARTVALRVPSAVLPDSYNVLLNPQHPRAGEVRVVSQQPFRFDPRLRPPR
jgi:RES domain-containing protein